MNFKHCIVIFTLFYFCQSSEADEEVCDKSKCLGPLKYYNDLDCKPVYKTPESCCPYKYDCDHLKNRDSNKCYINGHEYEIGEALRAEDKGPCDVGCFCSKRNGVPQFVCAIVDCYFGPRNEDPNCYHQKNATQCCSGPLVCPKPEDRPTCIVDGKTYKDGEAFQPASNPDLSCYCGPGYNGENVAPFCVSKKRFCQPELRHARDIQNNCVPVYYNGQSPQTSCSVMYRCQNKKDEVIPSKETEVSTRSNDMQCVFGDKVMKYKDELTMGTNYDSVCVKCVCEVGPIPTCQRLSDSECDVTKHDKFN